METKVPTSPSLKTSSFYSSTPSKSSKAWLEKQAKWQAKCEEFTKKPIPAPRLLRLDDPIPVFQRFPLQQLAFEFARSCSKDVHIFSEEIDSDGKRRYLVSTVDQFWQFYRKLQSEQRHFYEVITNGSACKLYFDLEFKKEFNQDCNGVEMLDIWIMYVCCQIKQHFDIICDRKHIIDLDSSNDSKFSRHLIFCLPGAVFKDNIHVGNFVNHICGSLLNLLHNTESEDNIEDKSTQGPSPKKIKMDSTMQSVENSSLEVAIQDLRKLQVTNSRGESGTFCDQGVYTKNRNFRLFRSTKYGKYSMLKPAKENLYKPDMKSLKGSFSRDESFALFLDSLICNVSHSDSNHCDVKILTFECNTPKHRKNTQGAVSSSQDAAPSGYEHSPYPHVDDFITTVINKGGVQGRIRRWVYFSQGKMLMFDIDKNRWCENIGRAHKSNHIIIIVDMREGVYYQKCHDPECRRVNYKSQEKAIPEEINPFFQENDLLDSGIFEDDQDDDILCQVAEEIENKEKIADNQHLQSDNSAEEFALLLDDDEWEPWKDLPLCDQSSQN